MMELQLRSGAQECRVRDMGQDKACKGGRALEVFHEGRDLCIYAFLFACSTGLRIALYGLRDGMEPLLHVTGTQQCV